MIVSRKIQIAIGPVKPLRIDNLPTGTDGLWLIDYESQSMKTLISVSSFRVEELSI